MFNKFLFIFFYIIISVNSVFSADVTSGLTFRSHTEVKEKRTSLLLNEGKYFHLPKGFSLEFDIKFRTEEHNYGYVYRIVGNDTVCFDLISNFRGNNKTLSFIERNKIFIPYNTIDEVDNNDWNKFSFKLDLQSQKITASFNNEKTEVPCSYTNLSDFRFQFGFCNAENFISYDVPPITIKDIRLYDSKNNLIAFWPLDKHNINEAYDSVKNYIAHAYNPIWEIDKHTEWLEEKHFQAPLYTQIAYNNNEGLIYFVNNDYMLVYDNKENRTDTIKPVSGYPFHISSNQLIYNSYTKDLISYDLEYTRTSVYDFNKNEWSGNEPTLRTPYTHHNNFISSADSSLYIFGGYKEYIYKNDLFKLDMENQSLIEIDYGKSIPPRYLSAVGFKNPESLLLIGGYGNESGKQELGPHNYYDLYEINTRNFEVKKLWKLSLPAEHYLFSNNMVVDTVRNKIYALTFPNDRSNSYIQLRSFDLENGKNEILADTIPFTFEDINSFCSLYFDSISNKLYAITAYNNQDKSNISIYSLLYPPLSKSEIRQKNSQLVATSSIITGIIILGLLFCIICFLIFNIKKRTKAISENITKLPASRKKEDDYSSPYPIKKSSILFLSGFQVWDKTGNDITKEFTPTLRNLLVLIILYTQKNDKGVSNNTLREILWNDKSIDKAENNRRVNIQKLKKLLDKLEGIELVNTNTYWTIKYQQSFFSDYFMVFQLMDDIEKHHDTAERKKLNDLLHLLSYGAPLPYLHKHWADPFISDYSSTIQEFLWSLTHKEFVKNDNKLFVNIADIIFLFDPTDEEALALKCSALYEMGKTGQAKMAYDSFCTEYKKTLGISMDKDFNFFLNKN